MLGTSLGPYKIVDTLGAGGMGEVYLAEDTRLGRKVAIKVLPAEFASDPERLARFEQEARAAAALNHPHIAAVFDVGTEQSEAGEETHFMVQEYLEGVTLRAPLDKGPMPLKKALVLATEIAEALGAAHAAGIVHRDLKPDNIFVSNDGHAKVLDFGLAKLTEIAPAVSGSASMSPTMLGTVAGQVMGTAGYMSPEQVNGEEVDTRADLFAFGCVLYEMVTGRRAFSGKNLPETLHLLSNTEPSSVTDTVPTLPLQLNWIVAKALAKDPAERYQAAGELVVDLRRLAGDVEADRAFVVGGALGVDASSSSAAGDSPAPNAGFGARLVPWAVAAVAVAVALWSYSGSDPAEIARTTVFLPLEQVPVKIDDGLKRLEISPDGRRLVYVVDEQLQLLDLTENAAPQPIPGTEHAQSPVFSPDGESIAFVADGELRTVRLGGGLPRAVATGASRQVYGVDWTADDRLLYIPDWAAPLYEVPAAGGEASTAALPDPDRNEQGFAWPSLLPDGEHVMYAMWDSHWNIVVRSLVSGESRVLLEYGSAPRYVPTGHLVFVQDQQLLAATFDPGTLQVGDPRVVLDNIFTHVGSGLGGYAFSDEGTLVSCHASNVG